MGHIVLLPYLPLERRVTVNDWQIVPHNEVEAGDAVSGDVLEMAPRYLALYRLPDGGAPCGCYVRPPNGRIGDDTDTLGWRALGMAITAAVLEVNPPLDNPDDGLSGHACTSDNTLIYGHPYSPDGFVAYSRGVLIRTLTGGLRAGRDDGRIEHPVELNFPPFGALIDEEYAAALHVVVSAGDDQARRIAVVIRWLDIAWRNTQSINQATRVAALRTAFEALLDVGDEVGAGAEALKQVLKDRSPTAPRTLPSWAKPRTLSDLQWWFYKFVHLRNAIMHGSALDAAAFKHEDGRSFIPAADEYLRRALRATVANAGFPALRKALSEPLGSRTLQARRRGEKRLTDLALRLAAQEGHISKAPSGADGKP